MATPYELGQLGDNDPPAKRQCADPEDLVNESAAAAAAAAAAGGGMMVLPTASAQPQDTAFHVVHVRAVPSRAMESDVQRAFSVFGAITQVLILTNLNQALVEFQV